MHEKNTSIKRMLLYCVRANCVVVVVVVVVVHEVHD